MSEIATVPQTFTFESGKLSLGSLKSMVEARNFYIGIWLVLYVSGDRYKMRQHIKKITTKIITIVELGFKESTTWDVVYDTVKKSKTYKPCWAEDAFYTRLEYIDQPVEEMIFVVTETIATGDILLIDHDIVDGSSLHTFPANGVGEVTLQTKLLVISEEK